MLELTNYQLKFVEYDSLEYRQAAKLRYRLFYQEHSIPFESIFTPQEKQNLHLVITTKREHQVLAYGRLYRKSSLQKLNSSRVKLNQLKPKGLSFFL